MTKVSNLMNPSLDQSQNNSKLNTLIKQALIFSYIGFVGAILTLASSPSFPFFIELLGMEAIFKNFQLHNAWFVKLAQHNQTLSTLTFWILITPFVLLGKVKKSIDLFSREMHNTYIISRNKIFIINITGIMMILTGPVILVFWFLQH
jgi:hypothetical protein